MTGGACQPVLDVFCVFMAVRMAVAVRIVVVWMLCREKGVIHLSLRELRLDLAQVAEIWRHGSVVRSWLLDLAARALADDASLATIAPVVADSGEGRWTVAEAIALDVPAPVITHALIARLRSRDAESYADRLLAALRHQFGGHAVQRDMGAGVGGDAGAAP